MLCSKRQTLGLFSVSTRVQLQVCEDGTGPDLSGHREQTPVLKADPKTELREHTLKPNAGTGITNRPVNQDTVYYVSFS